MNQMTGVELQTVRELLEHMTAPTLAAMIVDLEDSADSLTLERMGRMIDYAGLILCGEDDWRAELAKARQNA